jgi:hypothetical protein
MENCKDCGSKYDIKKIEIPAILPDKMCSNCGTLLSDDKIQELIQELTSRLEILENK